MSGQHQNVAVFAETTPADAVIYVEVDRIEPYGVYHSRHYFNTSEVAQHFAASESREWDGHSMVKTYVRSC